MSDAHLILWNLRAPSVGLGYKVTVYDSDIQPITEYSAGNHPGLDISVPAEDGVSNLTLARWAKQTALGYAREYGLDPERVEHDRDEEAEDPVSGEPLDWPEYAYTCEMPSGHASFTRSGWAVYDRDGDVMAEFPLPCEGLAAALTDWLNKESGD